MPFYKVPAAVSCSGETKRVRAPLRQSVSGNEMTQHTDGVPVGNDVTKRADNDVINRYSNGIQGDLQPKLNDVNNGSTWLAAEPEVMPGILRDALCRSSRSGWMRNNSDRRSGTVCGFSANRENSPDAHKELGMAAKREPGGQNLIAAEIREQRRREEELRRQWAETTGARGSAFDLRFDDDDEEEDEYDDGEDREVVDGNPHDVSRSVGDDATITSRGQRAVTSPNGREGGVTPIDDEDLGNTSAKSRFQLLKETAIERDARIARQREEELRKERAKNITTPTRSPDTFQVESRSSRNSSRELTSSSCHLTSSVDIESDQLRNGGHEKSTMKNLASSRLLMDVEREKRRERELMDEKTRDLCCHLSAEATELRLLNDDSLNNTKVNGHSGQETGASPFDRDGERAQSLTAVKASFIEKEINELRAREEELRKQRELAQRLRLT